MSVCEESLQKEQIFQPCHTFTPTKDLVNPCLSIRQGLGCRFICIGKPGLYDAYEDVQPGEENCITVEIGPEDSREGVMNKILKQVEELETVPS